MWREEGLRVPQRRKKKRLTGIGVAVGAMSPIRPNVIWAMDFQFDTTADGRTVKMLNVLDEFTREALRALRQRSRIRGTRRARLVPIQQRRYTSHRSRLAMAERLDRIVQRQTTR